MEILIYLLDVLCTFNELYWLYQWIDYIFEKRSYVLRKHSFCFLLKPLLIMFFTLITMVFNQVILTSPYTVIVLLVGNLITTIILWKSDILQVITVVGTYFLVLFIKGNIEISLIGFWGGNELVRKACFERGVPRATMIMISMFFLYVINALVLRLIEKKQLKESISKNMVVMTIFGLTGSFLFGKVFTDSFKIDVGLMWYMFVALVIILLYMMYYTMKNQQIYFRMHALEKQNIILEKYYLQIDDAYKRKSKMYHEMNHHLHMIYHFLESGESQNAADYIKSLGDIGDGQKNEVFTGINLIDAIFNDFAGIASSKGVEMTIKAQILPLDIGFVNSDMCSLLSNLLENAMDAAKTFVTLRINHIEETLYLKVENDYQHKPVVKGHLFRTIKQDSELHGWGTQIIEDIVRKYEGDYEFSCREDIFCVSIMINEKRK